jgi:hypothetical protein
MITVLRRCVARNIWVVTLKNLEHKSCPAHNFVIWSRILKHYFTEMITILRRCVARNITVVTLKVKVTAWPWTKKSYPAHYLVIWSWILKLFYRNDHRIKTMCRAQHLGRYREGQGHSMTLNKNRVRPITSLFEVGFYNYFTEMITILRRWGTCNIWVTTLKALKHYGVPSITSLFEVGFL